ncbi:hypothetical protein N431DRAFT_343209 [Stipitochalara longipes BDJ]|nr:hypothetical protein N431DRAFT_343209 [Stipitochalara longipes BDJ]
MLILQQRMLISCLIVSYVLSILRSAARLVKTHQLPFSAEDVFMYFGLVSFTIMCSLYFSYLPKLHNINQVVTGQMEPYASMEGDIVTIEKGLLMLEIFFWSTLWAVKLSLLFMSRKLIVGLSTYTKAWWGVMAFTVLTFVGCVISAFTSCSSLQDWFSPEDKCSTPRDEMAKAASLWYSFAADLLTDLMIMAIPIHILYTIRISTAQKLSAGIVFTVGIITMITGIVRIISMWVNIEKDSVTTLWSVIEAGVAIIVGCLPSFAIFIRSKIGTSRAPLFDTSPIILSKTNSNVPSISPTVQTAVEGFIFEDDVELARGSSDGRSDETLVDRPSAVTQGWSQRWHRGISADTGSEKPRNSGFGGEG